ncbi:MAG: NADP-dependent isocitrate dehydrogenase, partial [Actinomycetaceae bacterium]
MSTIIYTLTDEAPLLATYSLKPIVEAYARVAGVQVDTRDISLANRILAAFSDTLPEDQAVSDALAELGALTLEDDANIIKLPNVSASVSQLKVAIAELQSQGFDIPDYPDTVTTDADRDALARFDAVKGSAVNPVLRQGNSDRRAPVAVKNYAKAHPHRMGAWSGESRTDVATMGDDDFRANEKSVISAAEGVWQIRHVAGDGTVTVLKDGWKIQEGEVVDGTFMSVVRLREFVADQIARANEAGILFSLHLKATMMKVADPIVFGHVIEVFFADVFERYGEELAAAGVRARDGLGAIFAALEGLPNGAEIRAAFDAAIAAGPELA